MPLTTVDPVTPLSEPAPNRSMTEAEFAPLADQFAAEVTAFSGEFNTSVEQINTLAGEIEAIGESAEEDAGLVLMAVAEAEGFRDEAEGFRDGAQGYAAIATNAANVNGTSTDSESIPTAIGQQRTYTMVETGRTIVPGMFLVAAVTASPTTNWALFQVDSFAANAWTGTCKAFGGSGTFNAWTVSLSSARGAAGADAITRTPSLALSGTPTLTAGNNGYTGDVAAGTAIALDTLATLGDGWSMVLFPDTSGAPSAVTADFGAGSVSKALATPTLLSVKLVGGTYSVRWIPFGQRRKDFGAYGAAAVFLAAAVANQLHVVTLTATLALAVYARSSDNKVYAVALSVNPSTSVVTPGTPVLVENVSLAGTSLQLKAVSATDAVVSYAEGTNTKIKAMVLQVLSGTTVTTNTAYDVEAGTTSSWSALVYLSATKLVLFYVNVSSLNLFARTLDLSGSAITVGGSNTLVTGGAMTTVQAAAFSATSGVILQNTTASSIRLFSVSGSTITLAAGNGFQLVGIVANGMGSLLPLSATQFLAHLDSAASEAALTRVTALFEVDGSDIYSRGALNYGSQSYQPSIMLKQAADQVIAFRTSMYPDIVPHALDIQDGKVVQAAVGRSFLPPKATVYYSACLLSSSQALVVYTDPDNSAYGTAKILNLGSAAA